MVCPLLILRIMCWPWRVVSSSGMSPYMIHHYQPAPHESFNVKSSCHIRTVGSYCITLMNSVVAPHMQPINCVQVVFWFQWIMVWMCRSMLARLQPWSASQSSLDHRSELFLQTCLIVESKCISKLAHLPLQSACPNSLNHSLQVHLWVHSIVICRCTSNCS